MESLMNPTSKLEGSFSMDNVQAVSQEIAMMYAIEVATIPDKVLLDTAYDEFLDRAAWTLEKQDYQLHKLRGQSYLQGVQERLSLLEQL